MNINSNERILESLDRLQRAEAPDHFYAGIRAKMARQQKQVSAPFMMLRPVFISSVLFIFLIINIGTLTGLFKKEAPGATQNNAAGIASFAKEYNLNSESFGE